jgi:hypothetical protein
MQRLINSFEKQRPDRMRPHCMIQKRMALLKKEPKKKMPLTVANTMRRLLQQVQEEVLLHQCSAQSDTGKWLDGINVARSAESRSLYEHSPLQSGVRRSSGYLGTNWEIIIDVLPFFLLTSSLLFQHGSDANNIVCVLCIPSNAAASQNHSSYLHHIHRHDTRTRDVHYHQELPRNFE